MGTTGARAVAINASGVVLATASEEYPLSTPQPGWVEQDPKRWWAASQLVLKLVVAQVKEPPLALGLTGQMHGAVFLDRHDRVFRPALLWNDQRTANQCRSITNKVGADRLVEITGNPALTGFQAPKILWLREHEPDAYARIRRVLLPKDYIRLLLTGGYATDPSDASGTLLLDLRSRTWSAELLDALEIPREWLPAVYEGPLVTGTITPRAAEATGLPSGLPVIAGGGDNAAAAIGNGIVRPGLVSSSIGTSGVVFAHTDRPVIDPSGRLHAFCHAVPDRYHLMGVTLSAGGSLRWWRDTVNASLDYDALSNIAEQAPPGSEGLLFLPYLSGERTPHMDPSARGSFFGLTLRHSLSHMTRAVFEGVAYSLMDCLELVTGLGISVAEVRATGGGARSRLWRQLQADIFGLPVRRVGIDEGPAFGAALLASIAAGAYSDVIDACAVIQTDPETSVPDPERHLLYQTYRRIYTDLYEATKPLMHGLAELSS